MLRGPCPIIVSPPRRDWPVCGIGFSASATEGRASVRPNPRQIDEGGGPAGVIHALRGLLVVLGAREEYVVDVGLRIAVVERKPARLDLHHQAVAGQEHVVHLRQREAVLLHLARRYGTRVAQALAVTPAEYVHRDSQLVATHVRTGVGRDL